jgi:hypothetical protein
MPKIAIIPQKSANQESKQEKPKKNRLENTIEESKPTSAQTGAS